MDFGVAGSAAGMNPLNALLKYGRAVCGTVVVDVLQTVVTDQCSDGPAAGGNLLHTAVPNSGAVGQSAVFYVLKAAVFNGVFFVRCRRR